MPFLWDLDVEALDLDRDAEAIMARVLEHGRLADVRWLLRQYGSERIRQFFRSYAHPIVSHRTRTFWHAYFEEMTPWPAPPTWRKSSAAPWID